MHRLILSKRSRQSLAKNYSRSSAKAKDYGSKTGDIDIGTDIEVIAVGLGSASVCTVSIGHKKSLW